MTSEEIELWYEEEKQKLSERYIKSIEKGMPVDRRKKVFDAAMDKLSAKYNAKHAKLLAKKEQEKRNKALRKSAFGPLVMFGSMITKVFMFLLGGIASALKAKAANTYFSAKIFWIKNGYKVPDGTKSTFRPLYYFYVKHFKPPLLLLVSPFVRLGKRVKKKFTATIEWVKTTAQKVWKYMKIAFKFTVKHSLSAYKKVSEKYEAASKRYHDWQAKRIQADLDRKQKKKEEKEKRLKEKEAKKNGGKQEAPKEGESAEHPGQAPDAESST